MSDQGAKWLFWFSLGAILLTPFLAAALVAAASRIIFNTLILPTNETQNIPEDSN
jgi:hypothetical protein